MKEFRFGDVRGTVVHFLPVTSGLDKTSVLQGAEMMGYSGAAHIHYRGDVGDAFLMVAEQPEDLEPVGVAQYGHDPGDPAESIVVGKEGPEGIHVLDVAVVGVVDMWLAILADVGVMIAAVLNSARALRYNSGDEKVGSSGFMQDSAPTE